MTRKGCHAIFKFLLLICCLFSEESNAQQKTNSFSQLTYFKSQSGTVWVKHQLDSFIVLRSNKRYSLVPRTIGVEQNKDSLIYDFKLLLDPEPADKNNRPFVGRPLPDFNFKDINGNTISLQELKGKPVVINFWFTACVPCIEEMPALNELKEKYKHSDIVFLSITFENRKSVAGFLKKHPFNFTPIPGAQEYCDDLVTIFPLTLFINRQGTVQAARHNMPSLYNYETTKRIDELDTSGFEKDIEEIR